VCVCVCVLNADSDDGMTVCRYNGEKTLSWLKTKVGGKQIACSWNGVAFLKLVNIFINPPIKSANNVTILFVYWWHAGVTIASQNCSEYVAVGMLLLL